MAGHSTVYVIAPGRWLYSGYDHQAVKKENTPGTHNGKSYKSVTHLVTHCIQVRS
jgi:hypothetical protein